MAILYIILGITALMAVAWFAQPINKTGKRFGQKGYFG